MVRCWFVIPLPLYLKRFVSKSVVTDVSLLALIIRAALCCSIKSTDKLRVLCFM